MQQIQQDTWPRIRSFSGDWYAVPPAQWPCDRDAYHDAVKHLNESQMLHFEEGRTGWLSFN